MPDPWPALRWFSASEFDGDLALLDEALLNALDDLREALGSPIVIHPGVTADRAATPDSQHPLGRAVDCHAPGVSLLDFWLLAERCVSFTGIGVYPKWWHPGLHLDVRDEVLRARWWHDGTGYQPFTADAVRAILEAP